MSGVDYPYKKKGGGTAVCSRSLSLFLSLRSLAVSQNMPIFAHNLTNMDKDWQEKQQELDMERHKKTAAFFFTLAQLVFTAFVIGSLVIVFTNYEFTWGVFGMFFFGLALMITLFVIGNSFYNLKKNKEK